MSRAFLYESHAEAVATLLLTGDNASVFPTPSTRQQIILKATEQAVDKLTSNGAVQDLAQILLEGCKSMEKEEMCDPAIAHVANILEKPGG